MKSYQIERLKTLIEEIRKTTIYDRGDFPERAEVGNYILQQQIEKIKVAIHRIDDDYIKSQISQINSDFEYHDQPSAIFAFNKLLPLLDEVEDYLNDVNYNKIEIFASSLKSDLVSENNDKTLLKRNIMNGNITEVLNKMFTLFEKQNISTDELILLKNKLSVLEKEYNTKGTIGFEDFLLNHTKIVLSVITLLSEL